MKTFCRILSCLLVVLTLFACVACGSSTTKKENPTTAPTTGTETGNTEYEYRHRNPFRRAGETGHSRNLWRGKNPFLY